MFSCRVDIGRDDAGHTIMIITDVLGIGDPKDTFDGEFFGKKSFSFSKTSGPLLGL